MANPDVSVVMSVYNGARYLRRSVESILGQEGVDFEFIIVNDGSTDESPSILVEYAARDSRIRVIDQENAGLTLALIRGCREARGKYVARQDADDISMAGRLAKLVQAVESEEGIVMASSWAQSIGPGGEVLNVFQRPADPAAATRALMQKRLGPPGHGSVMFLKSAYERAGGYRRPFYYGQDSDLWLRMGMLGRIIYVPEVLYAFRYEPGSISTMARALQKQFGELGQACHKARREGRPEEEFLAAAETLRRRVVAGKPSGGWRRRWNVAAGYYMIASSLEKQRDRKAFHYFFKAAVANPLYWRAWLRLLANLHGRG